MTPWLGNDTAGDRTPDLRMTSAARDHLAMMWEKHGRQEKGKRDALNLEEAQGSVRGLSTV